jgi:hypothetical protein
MAHLELILDEQTAELLSVAAEISRLDTCELAAQVLIRDLVARTGWPGADGLRMRKALADFRGSVRPCT